jgi:ankyrin repeat protein
MGWSLLHYAAEDRNPDAIKLLAARGADLNIVDRYGWTPLHFAVDRDIDTDGNPTRDLPTAQALIDVGAREDTRAEDGATPRDIAMTFGQEALYDSLSRPKTT